MPTPAKPTGALSKSPASFEMATDTARPRSSHPTGLHLMIRNPHPGRESHGDCGVRSICLALDLPYSKVWEDLTELIRTTTYIRRGNDWEPVKHTAYGGVSTRVMDTYLRRHGWRYVSAPAGTVFKAENLPPLCIAQTPGHFVCIKDGACWDTWDSRGKRAKKLRGWFEPR